MEVVAVVHEGDGVTAGGPAHESQVLVVVEIILLKVNEVWIDIHRSKDFIPNTIRNHRVE